MASYKTILQVLSFVAVIPILSSGVLLMYLAISALKKTEVLVAISGIFAFVLFLGILICFGSLLWLFALGKHNKKLLLGSLILVTVLDILALTATVKIGDTIEQLFTPECMENNQDFSKAIFQYYSLAKVQFCVQCKCGLTSETILNGNYNTTQQLFLLALNHKKGGAKNFQQCPGAAPDENTLNLFNILGYIEQQFKCTGWCDYDFANLSNLYYKFWDVNGNKPQKTCYLAVKHKIQQYVPIVNKIGISVQIALVVACMTSFMLFCLPKVQRNQPSLLSESSVLVEPEY